MNEQTVTEIYSVDETVELSSISVPPVKLAPALRKVLQVGCLCNNAFVKDDGKVVGQSTDVALLKVLDTFGAPDERRVSVHSCCPNVSIQLSLILDPLQTTRDSNGSPKNHLTANRSTWP